MSFKRLHKYTYKPTCNSFGIKNILCYRSFQKIINSDAVQIIIYLMSVTKKKSNLFIYFKLLIKLIILCILILTIAKI